MKTWNNLLWKIIFASRTLNGAITLIEINHKKLNYHECTHYMISKA